MNLNDPFLLSVMKIHEKGLGTAVVILREDDEFTFVTDPNLPENVREQNVLLATRILFSEK